MVDERFWQGKKVFITGHTGFKGTWLSLWLSSLGAKVTGYALKPPTEPSLFELCRMYELTKNITADVRDGQALYEAIAGDKPEIVIHMAAQPLVRDSYQNPIETYAINVMGTAHLLDAVRRTTGVKALLNITTDKCYENQEWIWGYRENERLGGYDPYSNSKACSELITSSYRNSFFNRKDFASHGVGIASARAGNVIGGGDWAVDRLIPDCLKSILSDSRIAIRYPSAIRPWQHVLEPLYGYMMLAQKLYEDGAAYSEAWNFGPDDDDAKPVGWIVDTLCQKWGGTAGYSVEESPQLHEAHYLKLDCSKAKARLGWYPRWSIDTAIDKIVEWTRAYAAGQDMRAMCLQQINEYGRHREVHNGSTD